MKRAQKGRLFLGYVAENYVRLKAELRRLTSADAETFEDSFQSAVVKVHRAITKGDCDIESPEMYLRTVFLRCVKREAVMLARRERERGDMGTEGEPEDTSGMPAYKRLDRLKRKLCEDFGRDAARVFITYHVKKMKRTRYDYRLMARETGWSLHYIFETIGRINGYLKTKGKDYGMD